MVRLLRNLSTIGFGCSFCLTLACNASEAYEPKIEIIQQPATVDRQVAPMPHWGSRDFDRSHVRKRETHSLSLRSKASGLYSNAVLLRDSGCLEQSMTLFALAAEDNLCPDAYREIGLLLAESGQYKEACVALCNYLSRQPAAMDSDTIAGKITRIKLRHPEARQIPSQENEGSAIAGTGNTTR